MELPRPVVEIIESRSSWRTYDGQPLADDVEQKLRAFLAEPPSGPFGVPVKLDLLADFDAHEQGVKKLGTYGMIKGARSYIVGRVGRAERAMEDFGYVFEWAILAATGLGLGTCWLGGTFRRGAFGRVVGATSEELIPAVTPVGAALTKRRTLDRITRWGAGSARRKPHAELFFHGDLSTPMPMDELGEYGQVLQMVRLGPSASNRQPWRIVVSPDRDRFDLYLRRTAGYGRIGEIELQQIDMGIAMCHFELTARELDLAGRWSFERPDLHELPPRTEFVVSWLATGT